MAVDAKGTGSPEVIALLNEVLTGELTAVNQYFLHARMHRNWGLERLNAKTYAESIDEMHHADWLIERILYLGGLPNVQRLGKIRVGEDPVEALRADLSLEIDAIPRLNAGIALCREKGDNGSRALLEKILVSEEHHADWLETQLALVERLGATAYLAEQIHPAE
ncbi:MAG: bacterioferritin [Alphaproteobacteria bacterium]|nr:bacterioferritin [Alphaproteobacteria bacterium]